MTRRSARAIDILVDELLSLPRSVRRDRIKTNPRFHSLRVARRLTELSAAALPERPEDSEHLGETALDVLDHLLAHERIGPEAARVSCFIGNACRLKGDFERAEAALNSAALLVPEAADSALHLRTFALLRWDQGRCDEAVAS